MLARFIIVTQLVAHLVIQMCKTWGGFGWLRRNGISDHQQASPFSSKTPSTLNVRSNQPSLVIYLHGNAIYTTSLDQSVTTQVHITQYLKGRGCQAPRKPLGCAEHHRGSWPSIPAASVGGMAQVPPALSGLPQ